MTLSSKIDSSWPRWRLRFLLNKSRTPEEMDRLQRVSEVNFVPMEAVGENGGLDLARVREREDIGSGYTLFFEDDVLVAKITPCFENGKGAIAKNLINGIGLGTTEIYVLDPTPKLDPRFLFYLTISRDFRVPGEASMKGAAGQKRVPDEFIQNFKFNLPPIDIQHLIADYLDRELPIIDTLIAEKECMLGLLEEKRTALISHAVTHGLNSEVSLKSSGAPWFDKTPINWPVQRLKWVVTSVTSGVSVNASDQPVEGEGFGVLKTSAVSGGNFNPAENKSVWDTEFERLACPVTADTIIMSRMNTPALVGESGYVNCDYPNLYLPDRLWKLSFDEDRIYVPYLALLLSSKEARHALSSMATGTSPSMKNLAIEEMTSLLIPIPPLQEQRDIHENVTKQDADIYPLKRELSKSLELLKERRAALITAAVTGQITTKEVSA